MVSTAKDLYETQHSNLMKEWKKKHGADDGQCDFAMDGIVSPHIWFTLPSGEERILFLLKEAYTKKENTKEENPKLVWDEAKWLAHQQCVTERLKDCPKDCKQCPITGSTFNPIAEWVYGIRSSNGSNNVAHDNWLGVTSRKKHDYNSVRDELLSQVAIINIKKSSGVSNSDNSDLYYYAAWDKELLICQIRLINPTVIICGGTYGMLRCLFTDLEKLEDNNNGATFLGNIKVIASCHPNASIANKDKFDAVMKNYLSL